MSAIGRERPASDRSIFRFLTFGLVFLIAVSGLTTRLVYLQITHNVRYTQLAEANRSETQAIPSSRGLIYDRNGNPLVTNVPSFAVKIRLVDPEKITLRPGMTCRAEIFTATKSDVIAIPIQAIQVEEDVSAGKSERHVFVMRGSRAARVTVDVGLSDDTYQEIRSGLADTDEVITGPDRVLRALRDGDRVVVRKNVRK